MAPEPKKQATRGQKQIHKENQATIQFYTVLIVIVNAIYLAVTRLAFWSDFTLRYQLLFALTGGLYLGASGFMKRMSKSRFGADGNVVDAGVDLNMQSGMAEHLKDVIILMAIVQTTSLISNYMWLGLLVIIMTDLDDFFAKKDKKKPGKKGDSLILKTTDLFKVLDNAAQSVAWEDENEGRNKKEVQLGPVLSEVLKPEEASKWEEPVEEERQYDLTNLKIESLQTLEEFEEATEKAIQEASKPTKTWKVLNKEKAEAVPEKESSAKGPNDQVNPEERIPLEESGFSKNLAAGDNGNSAEVASKDGRQEVVKVDAGVAKSTDSVPEVVLEKSSSTAESAKQQDAVSASADGAPVLAAYVPPHLRNAAAKSGSEAPPSRPSEHTTSTPSTASSGSGAYVSIGMRMAMREEAERASSTGSSIRGPLKKPELDNEQEFPSLGGPSKHK